MSANIANIYLDQPDLANSILGKKIPIKEESGKETFHRETVYNISEVYNVDINYDHKSQTFRLTSQDNNKLLEALEVFKKIIEKKKKGKEDYLSFKKREKEREKRKRFYKKEDEIAKAIKYNLEHKDEIEAKEKEKLRNTLKKTNNVNPFYALSIENDSSSESDTDEPIEKPTEENNQHVIQADENILQNVEDTYENNEYLSDLSESNDLDDSHDNCDESNTFPRSRKYYDRRRSRNQDQERNQWKNVKNRNIKYPSGENKNISHQTIMGEISSELDRSSKKMHIMTEHLTDKLNVLIGIDDEDEFPELGAF